MNKSFFQLIFILCISPISSGQEPIKPLPSVLRYNLDLRVDYKNQKLYGRCDLTVLNNTDTPLEKIPMLLYRLLTVKSISNESGTALNFTQDIVNIKDWEKLQVNYIVLSPGNNLSPGEQRTITIDYEGYLYGYSAEGWRYVKDNIGDFTIIRTDGFGYPLVGYPVESQMMAVVRERYDYTIQVTVPEKFTAVSAGELSSISKTKGEVTYRFESKKPSWRLDIAIADYMMIEKNRNRVFCFREDSAGARAMLDVLERTINTYSDWFGDLKDFKGFSIIEVPDGYGSQADVTASLLTAENFKKQGENTGIYHELSHLWDMKPLEDEPCRFESEGRAQFLQFVLSRMFDNKKDALTKATDNYINNIRKNFTQNPSYLSVPVKDYGVSELTQYSYTLGMLIFEMYYDLAGEDNFKNAIRSYVSGYSGKGATLGNFIDCCIKYAPFDAAKFFNDWIYTADAVKQLVEGASYNELKARYR